MPSTDVYLYNLKPEGQSTGIRDQNNTTWGQCSL